MNCCNFWTTCGIRDYLLACKSNFLAKLVAKNEKWLPILCVVLVLSLPVKAPAQSLSQVWISQNRNVTVSATSLNQSYREKDTLGLAIDGNLDTERGDVPGAAIQVRWQEKVGTLPVWVQFRTNFARGQTRYNGYLQRGHDLTPYNAITGNTWRNHSVWLGMPRVFGDSQQLQAVPHVQWSYEHWQRNLVQYDESYQHTGNGVGLLLQWASSLNLVYEAGIGFVKQSPVRVRSEKLGFESTQSGGTQRNFQLAAIWRLPAHRISASRWYIAVQAERSHWENGQSSVVNGLQAPPNEHHQSRFGIGWGWLF